MGGRREELGGKIGGAEGGGSDQETEKTEKTERERERETEQTNTNSLRPIIYLWRFPRTYVHVLYRMNHAEGSRSGNVFVGQLAEW